MKRRNFTGDDLVAAETAMKEAFATYTNAKETYDYSISQGHASYAKRVRKPQMDATYEQYQRAKEYYDNILSSIEALNNTSFKASQQEFVTETMTGTAPADTKPNYTNLIYIGIAIVVIFFILKNQ